METYREVEISVPLANRQECTDKIGELRIGGRYYICRHWKDKTVSVYDHARGLLIVIHLSNFEALSRCDVVSTIVDELWETRRVGGPTGFAVPVTPKEARTSSASFS